MISSVIETFSPDEYIQTSGGNIISRKAVIFRPQSCEIPSGKVIIKDNVIIRGDLSTIQINKHTIICENTVIHPSYTIQNDSLRFIPITIGANTYIGKDCIVEAASIGLGCNIGENSILSKRCILKDYVRIEPNTIVPPDMVIPPMSIVSGIPAQIIGEVSESITTLAAIEASSRYKNMVAQK
jgi:dynactin 5